MNLKINFTLNSSSIVALINFGYKEFDVLKNTFVYKPLKYYTGVKVEKHEWDAKLKRPYNKVKNSQIEQIEKKIIDVFNYLKLQNDVTLENFKAELDEKLKGKQSVEHVKKVRIVDFILEEIITSPNLKQGSKSQYQVLKRKLIAFEQLIGKQLFSNEMNEDLYKRFIEMAKLKLTRMNSVWAVSKGMKAVLNEIARKYKIEVFNPSKELAVKDRVQPVSSDSIYFNFEQIKKIIDHEPKTEKLKNTKLILLTLIFSGCRHSDVHKIKPDHEYNKNGESFYYCRYFAEKTDTEIIVPILKPLMDAINDNSGQPAYEISQQKFNTYLKDLIQDCKLDEDVTITYTDEDGKKQFETQKLYKFVTSHIGRRSLITNLINHIPITTLTKITGHAIKDNNIIFGYNKISLLDNAILFRKQLRRAVEENPDHFIFPLV